MQNIFRYNLDVPATTEKKTVQIAVKIPDWLDSELSNICSKEDRPMGYVARELMIRGLELYRKDGFLRTPIDISKRQRIPQLKDPAK